MELRVLVLRGLGAVGQPGVLRDETDPRQPLRALVAFFHGSLTRVSLLCCAAFSSPVCFAESPDAGLVQGARDRLSGVQQPGDAVVGAGVPHQPGPGVAGRDDDSEGARGDLRAGSAALGAAEWPGDHPQIGEPGAYSGKSGAGFRPHGGGAGRNRRDGWANAAERRGGRAEVVASLCPRAGSWGGNATTGGRVVELRLCSEICLVSRRRRLLELGQRCGRSHGPCRLIGGTEGTTTTAKRSASLLYVLSCCVRRSC